MTNLEISILQFQISSLCIYFVTVVNMERTYRQLKLLNYIKFLDADDWMAPECLTLQVNALYGSEKKVAMVAYFSLMLLEVQGRHFSPVFSWQKLGWREILLLPLLPLE